MDEKTEKVHKTKNGKSYGITKTIESLSKEWSENITILDLSKQNLESIQDNVTLPIGLSDLNLSYNKFKHLPHVVLILKKLRVLNLSSNNISRFDDVPQFCNSIERMDLSNNVLIGPPYWIWSQSPKNLYELNLCENRFLTKLFENGYLQELLTYSTKLTDVNICNCGLKNNFLKILSTLPKVKTLKLGLLDYNYLNTNYLIELPCDGLDALCDIERLNVCNTHIYTINNNIYKYINIIELNASENSIHSLPNEFCDLANLEICILSHNKLIYLPDNMNKLSKLKVLCLDSNELCMITESLCELENLKLLDLYDNSICEVHDDLLKKVDEIDLAMNYFEEPEDYEYLEKKQKLRLDKQPRNDGRKREIIHPEKEYSPDVTDDEFLLESCTQSENTAQIAENSGSENWDSDNDDYWVPHYTKQYVPPQSPYLYHIQQKLNEGNFCPIDLHTVSISEQILWQKNNYPIEVYESDGQFDDCSCDDS